MPDVAKILLTPQVLMLAAGIVAVLWAVGQIPITKKTRLAKHWLWRNLLPVLPVVMGGAGAFLPGVVCADDPCQWGTKLLVGIWAGFVSAHGRKIFKRLAVDRLKEQA